MAYWLCIGDLEQRDRDETLLQFANKSACVLVATDVAARGLDIDALDANYHVAYDTEVHIHRIGRTGRAGKKAPLIPSITTKTVYKIALLEEYLEREITSESLPSESLLGNTPAAPTMITLQIDGGKKGRNCVQGS